MDQKYFNNKQLFYINSRNRISGSDSDFSFSLGINPLGDFDSCDARLQYSKIILSYSKWIQYIHITRRCVKCHNHFTNWKLQQCQRGIMICVKGKARQKGTPEQTCSVACLLQENGDLNLK